MADGQRVVAGKTETVNLTYEGRFEEVRGQLAPIWPFRGSQGELQVTISLSLKFDRPPTPDDSELETYRTALVNANQGRDRGSAGAGAVPPDGGCLMERFRVRVRHETKRGQIWELHMFPNMPSRLPREADAKIMGSSSSPETVQWLRSSPTRSCGGPRTRARSPRAISAPARRRAG